MGLGHQGLYIFKKFWTEKNDQEVYDNYINVFSVKNLVWGIWSILGQEMTHLYNSGSGLFFCFCFCFNFAH